jgi:hypothetical protein
MMRVWLNGQIFTLEEAHVSIADRGLLLGDGLFETMTVHNAQVFRPCRSRFWPGGRSPQASFRHRRLYRLRGGRLRRLARNRDQGSWAARPRPARGASPNDFYDAVAYASRA